MGKAWVLDQQSVAARRSSLESIELLARTTELPIVEPLLNLVLDHIYVLTVVKIAREAGITFGRLKPTEFYLHFVSALSALHFEQHVIQVTFVHGWPVLSIEIAANASLADANDSSSLGLGGDA